MIDPGLDWSRCLMWLALIVLIEMLAAWCLLGAVERAELQDDEDE